MASSPPAFSSPRASAASVAASAEEVPASALPEGYSAVAAARSGWVRADWVRADSAAPRADGSPAEPDDLAEPPVDGSLAEQDDLAPADCLAADSKTDDSSPVDSIRAGWVQGDCSAARQADDFPAARADLAEPPVADSPADSDDCSPGGCSADWAQDECWVAPSVADSFPADSSRGDCWADSFLAGFSVERLAADLFLADCLVDSAVDDYWADSVQVCCLAVCRDGSVLADLVPADCLADWPRPDARSELADYQDGFRADSQESQEQAVRGARHQAGSTSESPDVPSSVSPVCPEARPSPRAALPRRPPDAGSPSHA